MFCLNFNNADLWKEINILILRRGCLKGTLQARTRTFRTVSHEAQNRSVFWDFTRWCTAPSTNTKPDRYLINCISLCCITSPWASVHLLALYQWSCFRISQVQKGGSGLKTRPIGIFWLAGQIDTNWLKRLAGTKTPISLFFIKIPFLFDDD